MKKKTLTLKYLDTLVKQCHKNSIKPLKGKCYMQIPPTVLASKEWIAEAKRLGFKIIPLPKIIPPEMQKAFI